MNKVYDRTFQAQSLMVLQKPRYKNWHSVPVEFVKCSFEACHIFVIGILRGVNFSPTTQFPSSWLNFINQVRKPVVTFNAYHILLEKNITDKRNRESSHTSNMITQQGCSSTSPASTRKLYALMQDKEQGHIKNSIIPHPLLSAASRHSTLNLDEWLSTSPTVWICFAASEELISTELYSRETKL